MNLLDRLENIVKVAVCVQFLEVNADAEMPTQIGIFESAPRC